MDLRSKVHKPTASTKSQRNRRQWSKPAKYPGQAVYDSRNDFRQNKDFGSKHPEIDTFLDELDSTDETKRVLKERWKTLSAMRPNQLESHLRLMSAVQDKWHSHWRQSLNLWSNPSHYVEQSQILTDCKTWLSICCRHFLEIVFIDYLTEKHSSSLDSYAQLKLDASFKSKFDFGLEIFEHLEGVEVLTVPCCIFEKRRAVWLRPSDYSLGAFTRRLDDMLRLIEGRHNQSHDDPEGMSKVVDEAYTTLTEFGKAFPHLQPIFDQYSDRLDQYRRELQRFKDGELEWNEVEVDCNPVEWKIPWKYYYDEYHEGQASQASIEFDLYHQGTSNVDRPSPLTTPLTHELPSSTPTLPLTTSDSKGIKDAVSLWTQIGQTLATSFDEYFKISEILTLAWLPMNARKTWAECWNGWTKTFKIGLCDLTGSWGVCVD